MAMEITNNYNAYENVYATQKQQTEKKQAASGKETLETAAAQKNSEAGNDKAKSVASYVKKLEKLVPSVEFRVGNACLSAQSGKSLTVNSKLLEKMQDDPKTKKDMEDMIKGVESMSKLAESLAKASGWTIVYQHSYIDENGKYHCRMQGRNDGMLKLSDKLREERRRNSEKLIEKSKEKAAEKEKELEGNKIETEEKKADEEQEKSGITIVKENTLLEKAEQMILEKLENSEKGEIYLDDDDMQKVIEVAREQEEKEAVKKQGNHANPVGANLDLQI